MNLKVGDSVFVVEDTDRKYDGSISKIGRKCFYVDIGGYSTPWKFYAETMMESCNFRPAKCYLSRADYEQKVFELNQREACLRQLRNVFYYKIGQCNISTEKLKRICAILDE